MDRCAMLGYDEMTKFFSEFVRDESGAAAAEYALILAIVGAGIAGAAFYLGGKISTAMHATGDKVASCTTTATGTGC